MALAAACIAIGGSAGQAETTKFPATIDLTKTFGTRSPWRFVATRGPGEVDPDVGPVPGAIALCLKRGGERACSAAPLMGPTPDPGYAFSWAPRFLHDARIVYPRGAGSAPLLLTQTASWYAFNNDQAVFTQLLAYRSASDRFESVFDYETGNNNNQEVRYIAAGPLRGDVIVVEPANGSPWGYWVSVNRLTPGAKYHQILRYRSATKYADNNRLAVVDSEMPNIHHRLGLWRPGQPMPLPAKGCAKPRLVRMELWC